MSEQRPCRVKVKWVWSWGWQHNLGTWAGLSLSLSRNLQHPPHPCFWAFWTQVATVSEQETQIVRMGAL